jgi:polysaccharide biosynthesis transport protein
MHILTKILIKRLKPLIVITVIAMVAAAIWTSLRVTPTWKANCYVIRAPKNMSTPVEMPYLYQTFDINTILETVRTRDVLTDVIEKLELNISPDDLFGHVEVQRGNRSHVLRFSASWNDAEMAATIANATAESFIFNNNKLQNSATLRIYNYYLEQQRMRLIAIEDITRQYEEHRAQYGVISIPHETQTRFDQLKEIELKMIDNSLKLTEMNSKIAEMQDKLDAVPDEVIMTWTYTQTDERKLLALEKELELLLSRYTRSNPKVVKVQTEIDELRKLMENTNKRDLPEAVTWGPSGLLDAYNIDKARFEAEREAAIKKNEEYQTTVDAIKGTLENLTHLQKEFFEIERQLELNKDILRLVEGRLAEAKMAMQSNVSDFEILEAAKTPTFPQGGRKKLIVLLTGILIFGAGAAYYVGKELLSTSVKSARDFSDAIRIPLIGTLPDETSVSKQVFFRNLQVMLDDILRKTQGISHPVITLGNDVPETGKSFVSKEIISILCQKQRRILYIDSLKEAVTDTEAYLINDYLYERSDSFSIDAANPQIHYAYFLADDDTFSSVLETNRIKQFLSRLTEYDIIFWEIFDSGYNIQLFNSIASASSMLLLIARFDRSNRNVLARLVQFLGERDFHKIHGVLNYVPKDYFHEKY